MIKHCEAWFCQSFSHLQVTSFPPLRQRDGYLDVAVGDYGWVAGIASHGSVYCLGPPGHS